MMKPSSAQPEAVQDAQYRFPYHYLPRLEGGRFRFHAVLGWGHEYLSYISHVAELLDTMEWHSLLDVGCGDGRLLSILKERMPERQIAGLDYSERAIMLARAMVPEIPLVAGDITRAGNFDAPFDCATCIDTIEHIEPSFLPEFIRGIRDHLRQGALLIVTVPSTNVPVNRKHFQHFSAGSLTEVLSGPFEIERIDYLNGSSRGLQLMRALLTNRFYTITEPRITTSFYRHYVRRFLMSDSGSGGRLLAICRAK